LDKLRNPDSLGLRICINWKNSSIKNLSNNWKELSIKNPSNNWKEPSIKNLSNNWKEPSINNLEDLTKQQESKPSQVVPSARNLIFGIN